MHVDDTCVVVLDLSFINMPGCGRIRIIMDVNDRGVVVLYLLFLQHD